MVNSPNKLSKFWQELRRRKVLPFVIGYIAACFAIIEFMRGASETFSVSKVTIELLYILAAIGIPIVIVLPWYINRKKTVIQTIESEDGEINTESDKPYIQEKSIIVLPFENISPDPDQEYFSDGLTEEIISDLSHIHDLLVISRSSAMTFKGTKKKIREIASDVSVRYVLEGSVRKAENNLRITAQLIDASNDSHLWAEKYSGTLEDIFNIQEKVSQSIVDALKITLSPEEKQNIILRPITNFKAYDLHIKAQNAMLPLTEEDLNRATKYINQGLEIIGENEILYADLGQVYMSFIEYAIQKDEEIFNKVEESLEKVFSLNPNSANGFYLRGHLNRWKGNIHDSINDYNRALSIDPNHFNTILYLSWTYSFIGKVKLAEPIVKRLLKIDPLNPHSYAMTGVMKIMDGQFSKAITFILKGYELEPMPFIGWWLLKAYTYNNDQNRALQLMKSIAKEAPETLWGQLSLLLMYAFQNEKSKFFEILTEEFKNNIRGDELAPIWIAESYALMGHNDESIEWIEEGVNNHFINYPFLNEYNPFLDIIRGEKRFIKLMERVKYEWENFKV